MSRCLYTDSVADRGLLGVDAPARGMRTGASGTGGVYRRSKRSSSMTLTHAAAKSRTNLAFASSAA